MSKTPPRLDMMSRADFAALSLHAKNDYLQELAAGFAADQAREVPVLDKGALSRLRRYYSRRVWADLKLPPKGALEDPVDAALNRLGEAIRANEMRQDMAAALLQELPPRKRVLRDPPDSEAQLMFFAPSVYDAPVKDDVNLMDVAPFSLSKKSRAGVIRYELKDCLITIEGGAESGLATVFDYDIFLNMVTFLAEEVRRYRQEEAKGRRPSLPPKIYRPTASHILKFCRRSDGGKSYEDLEMALDRLTKTTIKVANLARGKRREVDSRPLIGGYRVVSRTGSDKIDEIEIVIPDWIYLSVVQAERALPLLTLNQDYFLISSGLGRFIYRLARKAAGQGVARYSIGELHRRSGSLQELRFFHRDLRDLVARTQAFPMPDYDLSFADGQEGPLLQMTRRRETGAGGDDGAALAAG